MVPHCANCAKTLICIQISIQTLYLWKQIINNEINTYLIPGRIGIWKCWFFWGEGKTEVPGEKPSRSKGENRQQTQPTYGVDAGIWTRATLVGGECSHQYATLAPRAPPLFRVVGSCCAKFELRANWRNNSQQFCVRLHGALHSVWLSICNGLKSLWALLQVANQKGLESFIVILIHQKS